MVVNIIELKEREDIFENVKLSQIYAQFRELLKELKRRELPPEIIKSVNQGIEDINSSCFTGNELRKFVKQKQTEILNLLEKELKIVPKNHYQNLWLALGMCVFGVPLGVAFGASLGNMGLLGIGIPIGLVLGIAVGLGMDKKAFKEGRQLEVEIKY